MLIDVLYLAQIYLQQLNLKFVESPPVTFEFSKYGLIYVYPKLNTKQTHYLHLVISSLHENKDSFACFYISVLDVIFLSVCVVLTSILTPPFSVVPVCNVSMMQYFSKPSL